VLRDGRERGRFLLLCLTYLSAAAFPVRYYWESSAFLPNQEA
jgi:hypothetical protein